MNFIMNVLTTGCHPDDIEVNLKLQILECHEGRLKWMREHDNIDFADMVKTCAKYRGYQCNAAYAEAFTQCLAYPKMQTKRLLP